MQLISSIACITIFFLSSAYGQTTSLKRFLLTSSTDPAVKAQKEKTDCLRGSFLESPFVNGIDFRIREDEFDLNQVRYEIRIKPKSIGETRAQYGYNRTRFMQTDQKNCLIFNNALKERYILFIEMFQQQTFLRLYDELIAIVDDKIKVMSQKASSTDFNINDLIKAEDENTQLRSDRFDIQKMINVFKDRACIFLNDTTFQEFDTTAIISIDSLINRFEKASFAIDTNNVYLQNYRLEFQIAQQRYALEKARSRRLVSFLSFAYDNGDRFGELMRRDEGKDYNLNKAYIVEIGLQIPDFALSRSQTNQRKADFLSEKENYEELKRSLTDQIKKDIADIRSLIDHYRFLKARENEVDATSSLKKYVEMGGVDPLVLLLTKESIIKNRIALAKVRFNVMQNYIQVLDVAGQLSRRPLINYLSAHNEALN